MISRHPSEIIIQEYASQKSNCDQEVVDHIALCKKCKATAAYYHLLFSEIKNNPKPAFDFNLSALVLAQLPKTKPIFSKKDYFVYFLVFVAISIVPIPLYLFRIYLKNMFTGISSFFIYPIITTTIIILLFQGHDLYKKYQKQMSVINFY